MSGSLYERIAQEGAAAKVPAAEPAEYPDPRALAERLREAVAALPDEARALGLFDQAGRLHDPATLDELLNRLRPSLVFPFAGAVRRRRLRDLARRALTGTREVGALELACAVLGAFGGPEDAPALEAVGRHPDVVLHAATALASLSHWQGRASLLRLLSVTEGDARVVVVDRLLPHTREPAVRLALVRDALQGLADEHAREVAADIAERCGVRHWIGDPAVPDDVRAAAERILRLAGDEPPA